MPRGGLARRVEDVAAADSDVAAGAAGIVTGAGATVTGTSVGAMGAPPQANAPDVGSAHMATGAIAPCGSCHPVVGGGRIGSGHAFHDAGADAMGRSVARGTGDNDRGGEAFRGAAWGSAAAGEGTGEAARTGEEGRWRAGEEGQLVSHGASRAERLEGDPARFTVLAETGCFTDCSLPRDRAEASLLGGCSLRNDRAEASLRGGFLL